MPRPASRDELKAYCLRALGDGVIQVNITDEQAEDRIDEALYVYQQYHMDAVAKTYLKHQITASTMVFNPAQTGTFANNEVIRGASSLATGLVTNSNTAANTISFYTTAGVFQVGESVSGVTSAANGTVSSITLGDADNKYVPLTDQIIAVTKIFTPYDSLMGADILFDAQAQFSMSLIANFTSQSVIPYAIGRQYQQFLSDLFRGRPTIRFERHLKRVEVDIKSNDFWIPGYWTIIECYAIIDPETYTDVYGDNWLTSYATALMKRQWGTNISKYVGIKLPGDVVLDGKTMLDDAKADILALEAQLQTQFTLPPDFITG